MSYVITGDGWFTTIGTRTVHRHDLTGTLHSTAMPWAHGHPIGVLWHYTDGYQGDISGSMTANGYITAQLSIGRDGAIYQYGPIWTAYWHAYAASQWGVGVEHEAHPPDSNLTDLQLGVSAEVFAAVIAAVKGHFGVDIPVTHIPGCDLTKPGLKQHADGLGCSWDPKGHSDKLYGWGWPKYLAAITAALGGSTGGDEMSDFADGWNARKNATAANPTLPAGKPELFNIGWHDQDRLLALEHRPASAGLPKHTHTTPAGQTLSAGT